MSADDIKSELQSLCPILDVYRLNRFVNGAPQPTERVTVTFRTNKLPSKVKMNHTSVDVKPFIRKAILCLHCLRYNHKTEDCRSKKRCQTCGEQHADLDAYDNCQEELKCLHCKGEHSTADSRCPERLRQNTMKKLMAKNGLTYFEAKEKYEVPTSNGYESLFESADEPTPGESFNKVLRKAPPRQQQKNRRNQNSDHQRSTSVEQQNYNEEGLRKRFKTTEHNGTALNNPEKATQQEQLKRKLAEAKQQQQETSTETINYHIQEALMRYFTAIMSDVNLKGKQKDGFITVSKKFLPFDMILKN